jgi:hypothetical protein
MKNTKIMAPFLLAMLLLTSAAIAQTVEKQAEADLPTPVIAARCQYTPADAACISSNETGRAAISTTNTMDDTTIAQLPRRMPGRLHMLMKAAPMPGPSLGHAAVGGLIGFVLGVAHPSDNTVRGHLALGMLVGLIGAALGAGIPDHPHYANPRGQWPEHDEEAAHSKPHKSEVALSKPDSPRVTSPSPSSTHTEDPLPAAEDNSISKPWEPSGPSPASHETALSAAGLPR